MGNCPGCPDTQSSEATAKLENKVAELSAAINNLSTLTKFLSCGLPIMLIQQEQDVLCFDYGTGKGIDCWEGWAVCNGTTHYSKRFKKNVVTPDFTDRFIVQTGGAYIVDDVGGTASVTLTVAEMPSHNHGVADPGHTHAIDDPGHDHGVTDPGHSHSGSTTPHVHTFTTGSAGAHSHLIPEIPQSIGSGGTGASAANSPVTYGNSDTQGTHTHSGTTDAAGGAVTTTNSYTGIDVTNAFTGITNTPNTTGITTQNQGSGNPHENLPPYYAALYVIYIG